MGEDGGPGVWCVGLGICVCDGVGGTRGTCFPRLPDCLHGRGKDGALNVHIALCMLHPPPTSKEA